MERMLETAEIQKVRKLSIVSSESWGGDDSVEQEHTPESSEDYEYLIQIIQDALRARNISVASEQPSFVRLTSMVQMICSEFLKSTQPLKELALTDLNTKGLDMISVSLMNSKPDAITEIFNMPKSGVYLTHHDCKSVTSLLIGAIRDSSAADLTQQVSALEEKLIFTSRSNTYLKRQLALLQLKNSSVPNQAHMSLSNTRVSLTKPSYT